RPTSRPPKRALALHPSGAGDPPRNAFRPAAAPGPVGRFVAKTRPHRVVEDVGASVLELLVAFDRARPEAVSPQMALPLVPTVERLGIDAVEAVAAVGELVAQSVDDQVVVVRYQAEGVDEPSVALHHVCEEQEEEAAVVVAAER